MKLSCPPSRNFPVFRVSLVHPLKSKRNTSRFTALPDNFEDMVCPGGEGGGEVEDLWYLFGCSASNDDDDNRIYDKILDCDWFSARLFVTIGARSCGCPIRTFCNWIPT